MQMLDLLVRDSRPETPLVRHLVLGAPDAAALPEVEAGAHVKVEIPGLAEPRSYSLVLADESAGAAAPSVWHLGVRLEAEGGGGSRFMHRLRPGDALRVSLPRNDFPLRAHAGPAVLIAGGIGITPILSHAAALQQAGRPFTLHYCAASRAQMAFLPRLSALAGAALVLHPGDEPGARLDLAALFAALPAEAHVYVCGPRRLLDATLAAASERDWPSAQLHFELFETAAPLAGDQPFEIELRQSGRVLQVPADQTIVDVLESAGCDPMYDCKRGECGVCSVDVLDGTPDHRDYFLSDAEKAAGTRIQICISRAKSARLVLDL